MATNEVLVKQGSQIVFGAAATWDPADNGTNFAESDAITVEMGMTAVANAAGVQSIKIDLGATRASRFSVLAAFDFTGETPTTGSVDLYWAPSVSGTQATGNIAGNSGADAALVDGPTTTDITVVEFVAQCQYIGSLATTNDATVQAGYVGTFSPIHRFGQMIMVNNANDAMEADEVECHIVMNPIVTDIQASA